LKRRSVSCKCRIGKDTEYYRASRTRANSPPLCLSCDQPRPGKCVATECRQRLQGCQVFLPIFICFTARLQVGSYESIPVLITICPSSDRISHTILTIRIPS